MLYWFKRRFCEKPRATYVIGLCVPTQARPVQQRTPVYNNFGTWAYQPKFETMWSLMVIVERILNWVELANKASSIEETSMTLLKGDGGFQMLSGRNSR